MANNPENSDSPMPDQITPDQIPPEPIPPEPIVPEPSTPRQAASSRLNIPATIEITGMEDIENTEEDWNDDWEDTDWTEAWDEEDDPDEALGGDPLIPVSELISNMARFIGQIGDPDSGQVLTVEQLNFDLPVELQLEIDDQGHLNLKAAPPTQQIETSVMPIFHQIKLSVVKDNEW